MHQISRSLEKKMAVRLISFDLIPSRKERGGGVERRGVTDFDTVT